MPDKKGLVPRLDLAGIQKAKEAACRWARGGLGYERARICAASSAVAAPFAFAAQRSAPKFASMAAFAGSGTALSWSMWLAGALPTFSTVTLSMYYLYNAQYTCMGLNKKPDFIAEHEFRGLHNFYGPWFEKACVYADGISLGLSLGAIIASLGSASLLGSVLALGAWGLLAASMVNNLSRMRTTQSLPSAMTLTGTLAGFVPALSFGLVAQLGALAALNGAIMIAAISAIGAGIFTLLSVQERAVSTSGATSKVLVDSSVIAQARIEAKEGLDASLIEAPTAELLAWRDALFASEHRDANGMRFFMGLPMLTLRGPRGAGLTSTAFALANAVDADVLRTTGARLHDGDRRGIIDLPYVALQLMLLEAEERARRVGRVQMVVIEHANLFCPIPSSAKSTRNVLISLQNIKNFILTQSTLSATRQSVVCVLTAEDNAIGNDTLPLLNTSTPLRLNALSLAGKKLLVTREAQKLRALALEQNFALDTTFEDELMRTILAKRLESAQLTSRHIVAAVAAGEEGLGGDASSRNQRVIRIIDDALATRTIVSDTKDKAPKGDIIDRLVNLHGNGPTDLMNLGQAFLSISSSQKMAMLASPQAAAQAKLQRKFLGQAVARRTARLIFFAEAQYTQQYNERFFEAAALNFSGLPAGQKRASVLAAAEEFQTKYHCNVLIPSISFLGAFLYLDNDVGTNLAGALREQQAGRRKAHFLIFDAKGYQGSRSDKACDL